MVEFTLLGGTDGPLAHDHGVLPGLLTKLISTTIILGRFEERSSSMLGGF